MNVVKLPLAVSFLAMGLFAQEAQVSGLVRDSSEAVMADVQISIVNQETGLRRGTRTNRAGLYAVAGIKPGTYKVTARQPGFQTVTRMDLKLNVAQAARVDLCCRSPWWGSR